MKRAASAILAAFLCLTSWAATPKNLEFRADGSFKIMQLTDLHLDWNMTSYTEACFKRLDGLVGTEQPDLIVVTGDMIFAAPAREMVMSLVERLDSYGIPWAVTYGNHDAEFKLPRKDMSALYANGRNSLNKLDGEGVLADLELPVCKDGKAFWYIYVMDSHDYSTLPGVKGYGWFTTAQVEWMHNCCKARRGSDGSVEPALAYFHIPLVEYVEAWRAMDNAHQGAGDSKHCIGLRGENIAHGALNTGMFAAMVEGGSVVGTFAGHDHDSNFTACLKGIALSYGQFSGCNTVYNNLPAGARIVSIKAGERTFETWIRLEDGRVTNHCLTDGSSLARARTKKDGRYGAWTEVPALQ